MLFTNIVLPLEEPAAAADEVHHGQQINAAIQDIPSPYLFFFTFSLTTRLFQQLQNNICSSGKQIYKKAIHCSEP